MEKYGGRLQGIMRTLKYVDLKSLRKGILRVSYLTNTCFVACLFFCVLVCFFCFIACLIANALKSGHCVICIRHVGSFFFFYLQGRGVVRSNDEMDKKCARGALGESRGMPHGKF